MHDFFKPQPIKNAAAFLLRFICHDWADPYAKKILKSLRASATPETKLVTVDCIVPYSCSAAITEEIPGAALPPVPAPLLPSLGKVNSLAYQLDLQVRLRHVLNNYDAELFFFQMWVYCNSQDRTLGHFVALAAECGWKVIQVHHIPGSAFGQTVSIPV